jgi:hypothetical protein
MGISSGRSAAAAGPSCRLLLLCAALLLAHQAASQLQRKAVEFSPSVALLYVNDVLLHSRTQGAGHSQWTSSRCLDMVFRASMYNAKRINFVVTSYFYDTNGEHAVGQPGGLDACTPGRFSPGAAVR